MNLDSRVKLFVKLGNFLDQLFSKKEVFLVKELDSLRSAIRDAGIQNDWFDEENILNSLRSISSQLTRDNLESWLTPYNLSNSCPNHKVLIVMAGNIPLVGFHDFLSVVITGNKAVVKLSSKDSVLFPCLWSVLCKIDSNISNQLEYIENLEEKKFDMVIATGSNNSFTYFESYFKNIKRLLRRNRISIAVLDGEESTSQLDSLAVDIFMYFGLGCRSVSKVFLPNGYDLDNLFQSLYSYRSLLENKKYSNNYDYNKTILLMNKIKIIENGFLIMKEDSSLHSPVSMLYYEYYDDITDLTTYIEDNSELIQCVVSKDNLVKGNVNFGNSQFPKLWDYADNVDTVDFLISD